MAAQQVHKRLAALCRSGVFLDKPVSLIAMEKFPPAITPPVSRTHRLSQERVAQRQLAHPFQRTGKRVGLEPALQMPPGPVFAARKSIKSYGDSEWHRRMQFDDALEAQQDPFEYSSVESDDAEYASYRRRMREKWSKGIYGAEARIQVQNEREEAEDLEDTASAVAMAEAEHFGTPLKADFVDRMDQAMFEELEDQEFVYTKQQLATFQWAHERLLETLDMSRSDAEKYLDMISDQLSDMLKEHVSATRARGGAGEEEGAASGRMAAVRSRILRSVQSDEFDDAAQGKRPVMRSRARNN